ncbi:MAG: DUF1761 domain-containing protein [Flavobacteriales bacterium]
MNYLEILIAAFTAFLLGAIWYSALFGKIWQREAGLSDEDVKGRVGVTFGVSFLMFLVISFLMEMFWGSHIHNGTIAHGAFHGMQGALFSAVPLMIINYLYQRKSIILMAIDGLYAIAFFAVIGSMLAALPLYETAPTADELKESLEWAQEFIQKKQDELDALNSN